MKKIILIRHGLTDFLTTGRYQGWSDTPLNSEGRSQIQELVTRFTSEKPEIIFSSPLERARESSEILNRNLNLEIHIDPRIKEISFGEWEGHTYDEILEKYPDAFEWWKKDLSEFRPEGGESLLDLQKRVRLFFDSLKDRAENVIAIVAHGGVIRAALLEITERSLDSFWGFEVPPAGMIVTDWEEAKIRV